jgi:hypothetical protein
LLPTAAGIRHGHRATAAWVRWRSRRGRWPIAARQSARSLPWSASLSCREQVGAASQDNGITRRDLKSAGMGAARTEAGAYLNPGPPHTSPRHSWRENSSVSAYIDDSFPNARWGAGLTLGGRSGSPTRVPSKMTAPIRANAPADLRPSISGGLMRVDEAPALYPQPLPARSRRGIQPAFAEHTARRDSASVRRNPRTGEPPSCCRKPRRLHTPCRLQP